MFAASLLRAMVPGCSWRLSPLQFRLHIDGVNPFLETVSYCYTRGVPDAHCARFRVCPVRGLKVIGSCRRDLLDHVIVLNQRHLKRLTNEYLRYYHDDRIHLGLSKQTPAGRPAFTGTPAHGRVVSMPRLGGLHHRYDLAA